MGATLAILCAFTWSLSVILFKKSGTTVHPILLNLCKNTIALVLLVPTTLIVEGWLPTESLSFSHLTTLLLSGVIGIGLADAMVLRALAEIGASRVAVIECTYSPFVILLSVIFLGESLTGPKLLGAGLVIAALACTSITKESSVAPRQKLAKGVIWGILGLFSMAAGVVMIKPIFAHVPLFWLITIRLTAGVAASFGLFFFLPEKTRRLAELAAVERKALVGVACILSTYVSMVLWVSGYKFQEAWIAAVLNQTSTIFTVAFAAIFLKEKFTRAKVAGTMLAVAGVVLIALA